MWLAEAYAIFTMCVDTKVFIFDLSFSAVLFGLKQGLMYNRVKVGQWFAYIGMLIYISVLCYDIIIYVPKSY